MVALMWTVNNFPTYGMSSGWGTHGRLACSHCMKHNKSFTLNYGHKICWFDLNHKFLPNDHSFMRNNKDFGKGQIETNGPLPMLTPSQV